MESCVDSDYGLFLRAYFRELIGRYVQLSQFVHQIELETRGETPKLLYHFSRQLADKIGKLAKEYPVLCRMPDRAILNFDLSGVNFEYLSSLATEFQDAHKKLRWMPAPWPETELFQFLSQVCRKPGLEASFQDANPTAVFSDEYNFLTSDVNRYGKAPISSSSLVVWALPKCEIANPLLWPVLVHEVAHGIFQEDDIVREVGEICPPAYSIPSAWIIELNADLFAFRLLGPAYLFCLIYFSVFFVERNLRLPVNSRHENDIGPHPPPNLRIECLYREFEQLDVGKSVQLRAAREFSEQMMRLYNARKLFDRVTQPITDNDAMDVDEVANTWRAIRSVQHHRYPSIDLPKEALEASIALLLRLEDDQIASSVHNLAGRRVVIDYLKSRFQERGIPSSLLGATSTAESNTNDSPENRSIRSAPLSRRTALQGLNDRAATVTEALNAGWFQKIHSFGFHGPKSGAIGSLLEPARMLSSTPDVKEHEESILELSAQLRKSIQIALVFSSIADYSAER